MAWEENPRICLHMQLIAILSRTGVFIKGTVVPSGDGGDRPSAARQEVGTAEGRD